MKKYYRIMLGRKSVYADECFKNNFIGAYFGIEEDLSNVLPDNWREFNQKFIPIWMSKFPGRNKVSAGLACGALWTIAKGLDIGDTVLCPNGLGDYYVGEVVDSYKYVAGNVLPHRRNVKWHLVTLKRSDMSQALQYSTGSIGTVSNISRYASELESLINGIKPQTIISTDVTIEDVATFAMEKHLEEFLIQNWSQTSLGKEYDIYQEDGEFGQQYPTDTGPIDVLAVSKDKKTLLVLELKKGRVSDVVVGQIQRYMGYVLEELCEKDQTVKGIIIGLDDDLRIRRALTVTNNIEFYKYEVSFKLVK